MSELEQPIPLAERKIEGKPLVLIIDDNPEYAKLFELLSDTLGITAHIVSSCGEGIRALEKFSFDVIIMDWLMPEVDGPACAGKIRIIEKGTGRHVPIIGVSGYVLATRQKCLDAGMDDYLPIPFTLEELHEKLCYWMQQKIEPEPKNG